MVRGSGFANRVMNKMVMPKTKEASVNPPSRINNGPNVVSGIAVPEDQVESLPPPMVVPDHRELEDGIPGKNDQYEEEDPYALLPPMGPLGGGGGMVDVPLDEPAENVGLLDGDRKSLNRSTKDAIYSETQGWDVFQVLEPEEHGHGNEKLVKLSIQIIKVFTYLLTFLVVLVSAVVAKGCLLFMAGNVTPGKNVQLCGETDTKTGVVITRSVTIPESVSVSWVWAIFFAYCIPEGLNFIQSLYKTIFRSSEAPPYKMIAIVVLMELAHTVGMSILLFIVLPSLDAVRGAMITNCLCFVPAFLQLLSRNRTEDHRYFKASLDILAVLAQVSGFVIWPLIHPGNSLWAIPVALVLISVVWWENFLDKRSPFPFIGKLATLAERLYKTRYRIYMFLAPIKCLVMLGTMIGFTSMNIKVKALLDPNNFFTARNMSVVTTRTAIQTADQIIDASQGTEIFDFRRAPVSSNELWLVHGSDALYVLLIQVLTAFVCYMAGKFACRICIQQFSFAFPINAAIPVLVSALVAVLQFRLQDNCFGTNILPKHLFWNLYSGNGIEDLIKTEHVWIWIIWLASQVWVTFHIWNPKCERLAKAAKLFVLPLYHGLIIDQSLAMNRRRDDEAEVLSEDLRNNANATAEDPSPHYETLSIKSESSKEKINKSADTVTKIIACATMWHETRDEMKQMLKSITRMDEDQAARRNAQEFLQVVDPDYYEYVTHIFFDDAFEISDEDDNENQVNPFVRLLCDVIDEAVSAVHQTTIKLRPPVLIATPYGGRLVWTFPGGTKMHVHLKDKSLIRHRKRWSQVMYMYYLLGYNLMDLPMDVARKETIAENTYLLTLDGDIDFKPHAVQLLVDLMKKNKALGAACGRIHPIGSGIMVWYQRFEYALGHWLQKATEHVLGCVMCCPGCFSLFRAKTLMDDNVMRRYAVKADEAIHYVQFDQGEDRWLCTLILQRGYRVEYCAASDAWTHAPEGFNEFFNQRRRWVPSTIANIIDLLLDAKNVVKVNDSISRWFIVYQAALMLGTILGPGTIFMMIIGACVAAFRVDNWTAFYANLIPILIYIVVCLACKAKWQLLLAQIMSTLYALLMMAVIVGTAIQISDDGWGSPSSIFLISIVSSFFTAALLHPQEFACILHGFLYFLSIPAMYLLLMIYSLCNLNVVSWGTRETATKKTKEEMARDKAEAEKSRKNKKQEGVLGMFRNFNNGGEEDEGGLAFNCGNLFKCMMFTHPKDNSEKEELLRIEDGLEKLSNQVAQLMAPKRTPEEEWLMMANERLMNEQFPQYNNIPINDPPTRLPSPRDGINLPPPNMANLMGMNDDYDNIPDDSHIYGEVDQEESVIKFWMKDKCFGHVDESRVEVLDEKEKVFWVDLIKKYLYPLDEDKAQQARIAHDLKELRNKSVFMYFIFNAMFILIIFLLQLNKYHLHVDWPLGVKMNVTIVNGQPKVTKEYLQLEPIGIVFVVFFFLILVIQSFAMILHRLGTLSHILAATEIDWFKKRGKPATERELIEQNAIEIARNLQALRGMNDAGDNYRDDQDLQPPGFRKTIAHLEKQKRKRQKVGTLDVAFRKRFQELTAAAKAREAGGVTRRKYPVKTIDPEAEKAIAHLVEEQHRAESIKAAQAHHVVSFNTMDETKGLEKKDMFDSAENLHAGRGAMNRRRRLEDIFSNLAGRKPDAYDPNYDPGFTNSGFDPYDLGDNTISGDFEEGFGEGEVGLSRQNSSAPLTPDHVMQSSSRPRSRSAAVRSPSVRTLDHGHRGDRGPAHIDNKDKIWLS